MTKINIRPMPEGYPSDCWIVTGPIWSSEVRYYQKLSDAKKYANRLIKQFKIEGYYPSEITIEQRLSDRLQRLPILTEFNESEG